MATPSFEDLYAENQRLKSVQPVGSKATLFVIAVIVLCVLMAGFALAITLIRPETDNGLLILTVSAIVVPVITGLLAGAIQQVHLAVNSRLSQLLELTASSKLAEGKLAGLLIPTPGSGENAARAEGKADGVEQERVRTEHAP